MTDKEVYAGADRAVKQLNRKNLQLFGRLKLAKFDEITLLREVNDVYAQSETMARQRYWEVAVDAYIMVYLLCGKDNREATERADLTITGDWVLDILEMVDPVTMYRFTDEADRKAQRLTEALSVAQNKSAEVDKALKYWAAQIGQYAITIVDAAMIQAFKDAGVEEVQWHTQGDERVCDVCDERNLRIYPIDKIPPKAHWSCRCWIQNVSKPYLDN